MREIGECNTECFYAMKLMPPKDLGIIVHSFKILFIATFSLKVPTLGTIQRQACLSI
jgi:hypothetical protein